MKLMTLGVMSSLPISSNVLAENIVDSSSSDIGVAVLICVGVATLVIGRLANKFCAESPPPK